MGVRAGGVEAGIRYQQRLDLALIELVPQYNAAAVFTTNAFRAAPVLVAKRHLQSCQPRFLLINAEHANAGMGDQGVTDALTCCEAVADYAKCDAQQVLPFSTGVIGERLPVKAITSAIPALFRSLSADGWLAAAQSIMTTDTMPKGLSKRIVIDDKSVTITGIAKGAGMIRPDMATMLAFVMTDMKIAGGKLQAMLYELVNSTFNCITVDGDTSTNDACVLIATGNSGMELSQLNDSNVGGFDQALKDVFKHLAQAIVRDAEGATKFVTIKVQGAKSQQEGKVVAWTIAHSPLVKTALFAGDPNWGRILAAVGRSDVRDLNVSQVEVYLGELCIVRQGMICDDFREEQARKIMQDDEFTIMINLNRGQASSSIWTSDLSLDYVRINAEYRT